MLSIPPSLRPQHNDSVYRSLRGPSPRERIGCGCMVKSRSGDEYGAYRAPTYSLVYILDGAGTYHDADGHRYPLESGWAFERRPDEVHRTVIADGGWRECFVDLGPNLYHALSNLPFALGHQRCWWAGACPGTVRRLIALRERLRHAAEGELLDLLTDLLAVLAGFLPRGHERDRDEQLLEEACRLLAEYGDSRLPLRALCARHGIGYERFRKLFTRRLGVSPGRYRIRRRMDRACQLLMDTDLPIAAIAEQLGYATPYEFSAQFRRHLGRPPSRYRCGDRPG